MNLNNFHGLVPFPARGKHPTVNWKKFQTNKPTPQQIQNWLDTHRGNWATLTGNNYGLIVVDIDEPQADPVKLIEIGKLPQTPIVQTSRGYHIYFAYPAETNGNLRNSVKTQIEGIGLCDVRGDGGLVIIPPSVHESGTHYKWLISPGDAAPAQIPSWLLNSLINERNQTRTVQNWGNFADQPIGEGGRNDKLTRLAGHLIGRRVNPSLAASLTWAFNLAYCIPPLEPEEISKLVISVISMERRKEYQND